MIEAAEALAKILATENAALAALDLTGASDLLAEKQRAIEAFAARHAAGPAIDQTRALAATRRLAELAEENRRLLERGIAVQARVIKVIARAAARAPAASPVGYGAAGVPNGAQRPPAMALCARA